MCLDVYYVCTCVCVCADVHVVCVCVCVYVCVCTHCLQPSQEHMLHEGRYLLPFAVRHQRLGQGLVHLRHSINVEKIVRKKNK